MKNTPEDAIESLLKNKNLNLTRGDSDEFSYGRIAFGIPALDTLTGGGIPKKRLTLIYGATNVGKSYLASKIVVNAQQMGGSAIWIDTELSYDKDWMATCGVDPKKILISQEHWIVSYQKNDLTNKMEIVNQEVKLKNLIL